MTSAREMVDFFLKRPYHFHVATWRHFNFPFDPMKSDNDNTIEFFKFIKEKHLRLELGAFLEAKQDETKTLEVKHS